MIHREPLSMTPVDAMALVAGVAVSFQTEVYFGIFPPLMMPQSRAMLAGMVAWSCWVAAMAVSFAIAGRVIRYGRKPSSAEWLAILTSLGAYQGIFWVDRVIYRFSAAAADSHASLVTG